MRGSLIFITLLLVLPAHAQAPGFQGLSPGFSLNGGGFPTMRLGLAGQLPSFYRCMGGQITSVIKNATESDADESDDYDEEDDTESTGAAISKALKGGFNVGCAEPGTIQKNPTCSMVVSSGKFDSDAYKNLLGRTKKTKRAFACQKGKLSALESELKCLTEQSNGIIQAMSGMEAAYNQQIGTIKGQLGQIKSAESDRRAQEDELSKLLKGDDTTPGLLQVKQDHLRIMDAMAAEKLQVEGQFADIEAARKRRTEFEQVRKAALMRECFNTRVVSSKHKCTAGDPASSPRNYLLCRYNQNALIGAKGQIQEDSASKRGAQLEATDLNSLMEQIFGDVPTQSTIPVAKTQQDAADFANQPVTALSPEDIEKQYGPRLKSLSKNGIDVYGYTMEMLNVCFARGSGIVLREMAKDNTQLGQMRLQIKTLERAGQATVNKLLTKYMDHYADVHRAFKLNSNLDGDACRNQNAAKTVSCFEKIRQEFDSVMFRKPIPPIVLKSGNPSGRPQMALKPITCSGIQNCLNNIDGLLKGVRRDIGVIAQEKQQFVEKVNTSLKQAVNDAAQRFGPAVKGLTEYSQRINAQLAALGVRGGVKIDKLESSALRPDQDGLLSVPEGSTLVQVINGSMDPKLPNIGGDSFAGALDGVADRVKKIADQMQDAEDVESKIRGLKTSCVKDEAQKIASRVERSLAEFKSKCDYDKNLCDGAQKEPIQGLADIARQLEMGGSSGRSRSLASSGSSSLDSDITGPLYSGIQDLCQKRISAQKNLDNVKSKRNPVQPPPDPARTQAIAEAEAKVERAEETLAEAEEAQKATAGPGEKPPSIARDEERLKEVKAEIAQIEKSGSWWDRALETFNGNDKKRALEDERTTLVNNINGFYDGDYNQRTRSSRTTANKNVKKAQRDLERAKSELASLRTAAVNALSPSDDLAQAQRQAQIENEIQTGENNSASCYSIVTSIRSGLKQLQALDKSARGLAGGDEAR